MPRTVFITGCSSGIGRAAAIRFARHGFQTVATSRKTDSLRSLAEIAERERLHLRTTVCDVTDEASIQHALAFARDAYGRVDVLVNNAGYGAMGALEVVSLEEARKQFEVNVFGAARLIQLTVPEMRTAGWGRIINVSSIAGRIVVPLGAWYSASKFGMEALADSMRLELEPFGIYCVSVLPGPVKSDFLKNISVAEVPAEMPKLYRLLTEKLKERREKRAFEVGADRVAEIILRAAQARRPKAKYVITVPAKVGSVIRPFFSDRMWDRLMKVFYGMNDIYKMS